MAAVSPSKVQHRAGFVKGVPTMYLGMDGTGVPMRVSEPQGCEGKQPDGRSRTRDGC